jgi:hypothetical protein
MGAILGGMGASRIATAGFLCLALSGCYATLYGNQSTGGGTNTTTTAGHVSGSTQGSTYKASFSSGGHPVSPKASGGYVAASGSAAYAMVGVFVLADLFYYMVGPSQPKPLAPDTRIADTCSCYRKTGDEVTK